MTLALAFDVDALHRNGGLIPGELAEPSAPQQRAVHFDHRPFEILYNEYDQVGAFATASLLALLALVTLAIRTLIERHDPDTRALRRGTA